MSTTPKTILFVEDENDLIDIYHLIFEDHEFKFLSTSNIQDAYMICEREQIDLILLDIILPGTAGTPEKAGFDFLQRIKRSKEAQKIPVVILTNLSSAEDKRKGLALGAEAYMVKAEKTPQEVLTAVERILAQKGQ